MDRLSSSLGFLLYMMQEEGPVHVWPGKEANLMEISDLINLQGSNYNLYVVHTAFQFYGWVEVV